jgi:uncharacterized protein
MELENIIRIIIFAKRPLAGQVKTRLISALGAQGAADLAQKMLLNTVQAGLKALELESQMKLELCIAPDASDPYWQFFDYSERFLLTQQFEGDLGCRMANAAEQALTRGERVILIGTDCPAITANLLIEAAKQLDTFDAVMHPTFDGGYALLALKIFDISLFSDILWSTNQVAKQTLKRIHKLHWSAVSLQMLNDIDEPEDLKFLPT